MASKREHLFDNAKCTTRGLVHVEGSNNLYHDLTILENASMSEVHGPTSLV